jgi:hypothetical protein
VRIVKEAFEVQDFPVKGLKTSGVRLATRETEGVVVNSKP